MSIIFEKRLTRAEAADIIKNYPEQARFVQFDLDDGETRYVRELSEEAAIRIVKERPYNFRHMKNPTFAVCMTAAGRDPLGSFDLIPKEMRTLDLLTVAVCRDPYVLNLFSSEDREIWNPKTKNVSVGCGTFASYRPNGIDF